MPPANFWHPGKTIAGRYRLNQLLGRGGVGEVWHAEDLALQREIAIKTIIPEHIGGEQLERFAQEARVVAKLTHPGIVAVYDVGREDQYRFIVMEYVQGTNLGALISASPISVAYGLRIAIEVSRALLFAHQNGVLHRDIKPGNVLIDRASGNAKLTDFGLAKNLHEMQSLTVVGTVMGTPAYMSPEQFSGTDSGEKSDIYALGATLYHMFTGQVPHGTADMISVGRLRSQSLPSAPSELRADLPAELNDMLLRMLQPDPAQRFASIAEVIPILAALQDPRPASELVQTVTPTDAGFDTQAGPVGALEANAPTGFFSTQAFPRTQFFADDSVRYIKIQESLKFYRDHLSEEYQNLLGQAKTTYRIWIGCVVLGFVVLVAGVVAMLTGAISEGIATAACTVLVYFIQRVFQQREDHYRTLAKAKNGHLEYGNQWLLVIQSIDSIEDRDQRMRRQEKLVDVPTEKLGGIRHALDEHASTGDRDQRFAGV